MECRQTASFKIAKVNVKLFAIFAIVFPLIPLFALSRSFAYDWDIHGWFIHYFGVYFGHHRAMPEVVHTLGTSGLVQPLFYGKLFYSLGGIVSSLLGAGIAIRMLILLGLVLQFFFVRRLMRNTLKDTEASFIAAISCWAIYPWTCLYNRGDIPECFASFLLTAGLCLWLDLAQNIHKRRSALEALGIIVIYSLMFQTHPITAAYGSLLTLLFGAASFGLSHNRARLVRFGTGIGISVLAVSLPWLLLVYLFRSQLGIAEHMQGVHLYPEIDAIYTRFMPFPFDFRAIQYGAREFKDTPYLDSQINVPLLCLALYFLWIVFRERKHAREKPVAAFLFTLLGTASFIIFVVGSLCPAFWKTVPRVFFSVQFGYRLVAFINLSLLMVIHGAAILFKGTEAKKPQKERALVVWTVVMTVSMLGVAIKITHAISILRPQPDAFHFAAKNVEPENVSTLLRVEDFFVTSPFSFIDRAQQARETWKEIAFGGRGRNFGRASELRLSIPAQVRILTNILPFPWNRIRLDGDLLALRDTPLGSLRIGHEFARLTQALPPGNHVVSYEFLPPPYWRIAQSLSNATALLVLVALVALAMRNSQRTVGRT